MKVLILLNEICLCIRSDINLSDSNMNPCIFSILLASSSCYTERTWSNIRNFFPGIPGWFIGEIYKDCNVTCAAHSLVCTENEMWNHNSDVDSPKKLAKLINRLQGMNSFSSCYGHYGNFTDVPNFSTSERFCLNSSPDKPRVNVACGQKPNYQLKKRLCYCHSG